MVELWMAVRSSAARDRRSLEAGATLDADRLLDAAKAAWDLTVERFVPGLAGRPSNLKGRLDRETQSIIVSRGLAEGEARRVTAHELAHYRLHDAPVLDDRSDESPTRPGVRQGYSTREVREAQADAYAAEFLCPAGALRRMLAEGVSATRAAERFGVDVDLVLSQAAVALLGPAEGFGEAPRALPSPDPGQASCAAHPGPLLVRGAAGSGKTTALLTRAVAVAGREVRTRDRRSGSRPAASLLYVTPTDDVAREVRAALAVVGRTVGESWIGTFEALALEILLKWHDGAGRTERVRLLDRSSARLLSDLARSDVGGCASDAAARARGVASRAARARAAEAFHEALEAGDLVTDALLLPLAVTVLKNDGRVLARLRERFRHVLVDDLHEAPREAVDLLALLCGPSQALVATADVEQAILGHRGIDGSAVAAFEAAFDAEVVTLKSRWRAEGTGSDVGRRGRPRVDVADDPDGEAVMVRDEVQRLGRAGVPPGSQAVLARTHAAAGAVAARLEALGTATTHLGDVHRRSDARTLLAVVGLAVDDDPACLARVAALRTYGVPEDEARRLSVDAVERGLGARRAVALAEARAVTPRVRAGLARLGGHLAALDPAWGAWRVLSWWLFEQSGHLAPLLAAGLGASALVPLCASHVVLDVCGRQGEQGGRGVRDLLARLALVGSDDAPLRAARAALAWSVPDALTVSTVHACRHREFRAVHLTGVADGQTPLRSGDPDEERRVFHVALTRARSHVRLTRPLRGRNGSPTAPSPLASEPTRRPPPAAAAAVGRPEVAAPPRPPAVRREEDVAAYMACPAMYRLLGLHAPAVDGPAEGAEGSPGEEWRVDVGPDVLSIRVASCRSRRSEATVRHLPRGPSPAPQVRVDALGLLLRRESARRHPDRLVRVEHLGVVTVRHLLRDDAAKAPAAYARALAGIAREDFDPAPAEAGTCVGCPRYFACE